MCCCVCLYMPNVCPVVGGTVALCMPGAKHICWCGYIYMEQLPVLIGPSRRLIKHLTTW